MNNKLQQSELINKLSSLAVIRTLYSSERSVIAWMRTSATLYTFGFTITKFVSYMGKQKAISATSNSLGRLGLILILIGIIAIILAITEHLKRVRIMKSLRVMQTSRLHLPIIGAILLLVIGITTLFGIMVG